MPTAIKEKPAGTLTEVPSVDAQRGPIAAEQRLRQYAREYQGRTAYRISLAPGDAFLLRAAGFNPDETVLLEREFARIDSERTFRRDAGTNAALKAAQSELAAAAAAEREQAPAIEAEIAKLQAKLDRLRTAKQGPAARVEAMQTARARLRTLLPPFLEQEIALERQRAANDPHRAAESDAIVSRMLDSFVECAADAPLDDDDWLAELSW